MRRLWLSAAGVLIGLSAFAIGDGQRRTDDPAPPGPTTSTSDELADMVMDVIQHGTPAAPTTTPVPAPPH